jgi:RES domain-containing protein
MELFRLTKKEHANLEGTGGLMFSGRWHEKGVRVIYTASSRSLALLEYLVHITDPALSPKGLVLMTIYVPDLQPVIKIEESSLPVNWKENQSVTSQIGTNFLKENKILYLAVPSAIVSTEYNFIINPAHKDIANCKINGMDKFSFDNRLLK